MAKLQKKSIGEGDEILQILWEFWGYSEFRPLQEEIIRSVLAGRDTLALMPTGGGKSLTFQVPSLAMEGICLVVTPLIALMKDQVEQLNRRKIKAAALHSGMGRHEIDITLENCRYGDYKFLYVSPERLATEIFSIRIREMKVNLIAVDEAHCISQWGYDFRPSYLEISHLRTLLPGVPVLALTATATPEVCRDIQQQLLFKEPHLLGMSFDRENLSYLVRRTGDKAGELLQLVKKINGSGIVYVRNRRKCHELAGKLKQEGITAEAYHAGLSHEIRDQRQEEWSGGRFRVMVATNAFGMGIDKPDVRFVIHMDLPDGPEAYFQEAGRAGRDGKSAYAVLLYSEADGTVIEKRLEQNFPPIRKIREIYTALCNFLQVPEGSGKGQQYDFEMGEFLHRYRLNAMLVHSAMQVLTREGYLALTDAFYNPSRILFRVGRDDLYGFQIKHEEFDGFIKLLLRSYSGLFSQYVKIDEAFLAKRSGIPREKVYHYLKTLSSRQIIHYIPRKEVPVITFLEERLEMKNLLISPKKYQFRKERYEKRIREMYRYASSEFICRNQFLLSYFGQMDTPRCGRCDVCRASRAPHPPDRRLDEIREKISGLLAEGDRGVDQLVEQTGMEADPVLEVLEWMIDRGWIERKPDLTLRWKGSPG